MSTDLYLFNFINNFAGKWNWLDFLGIFFAEYLCYVLLFILLLLLFIDVKKYWKIVAEVLIAGVFTRFILAEIIRKIYFRPRPFVNNDVNLLIPYNGHEASFPSGHALFFFALSTIIYIHNKKAGVLFYIASFLIVLGRVFTGIHWPSDILAGAVFGILTGLILNNLFKGINVIKKSQ